MSEIVAKAALGTVPSRSSKEVGPTFKMKIQTNTEPLGKKVVAVGVFKEKKKKKELKNTKIRMRVIKHIFNK